MRELSHLLRDERDRSLTVPDPVRTCEILISFTDPDARSVVVDGGVWFALGLRREQLDRLARAGADERTADRLVKEQRDALILLVSTDRGAAVSLAAWRGILAGSDLYYAVLDDRAVVVSDHFRNVVSFLPVEKRAPSDDALLEHYLTGWIYDRGTYSSGAERLAVGDRLKVDLRTGKRTVEVFDRIVSTPTPDAKATVVERVEAALEGVMKPLRESPDVCTTFSGGVDSTLLATFMDDQSPLVAMTTDTPEFGGETEYARKSAKMLDRELTEFPVAERDYLPLLEDTVDRMAMPLHYYVIPMLATLYQRPESTYVLGEGADSVFGTGRGLERVAGLMSSRPGRATLGLLRHVPGPVGSRSDQVLGYAARFSRPPLSLDGEAGRTLVFGDTACVESIVDAADVDRLLERHLQAIQDRVVLEAVGKSRFHSHMEISRWRNILGDVATIDRHLAQSEGRRVLLPFADPSVVSELLSVPVEQRYLKGMTGKWVLKEILVKRVPEYRVNQRKHATGLPFERYYTDGPLVGIWDRYDVPDFIAPSIRDEVVANPTAVTWNAIIHAVWSERIERNRELRPHPASLIHREQIVS